MWMEETVIGRSGVPVFAVLVGVSSFEADWGVCADVEDKMLRWVSESSVPQERPIVPTSRQREHFTCENKLPGSVFPIEYLNC